MATYQNPRDGSGIDTQIYQGAATTNYGTVASMASGWLAAGNALRILMRFDLSSIPSGATVSSATLTLTTDGNGSGNAVDLTCYRQTHADWSETQSTWNIYKTGSNWSTAGGEADVDYETTTPTPSTASMTNSATEDLVFNDAGMVALVQDALDNRSGLLDLLIKGDVEAGGTNLFFDAHSAESGTESDRPLLVVVYSTGKAAPHLSVSMEIGM